MSGIQDNIGIGNNSMIPPGGTALKGGLGSIMGKLNPYMAMIDTGLDVGGKIAQYFRTSPNGLDKQKATGMQTNIQQAAMQIQDAVSKGTMRPEAALIALQNLQTQANGMEGQGGATGNTANFQAGGQTASIIISNIIANVKSGMQKRNDDYVNQPWKESTAEGSADPNGATRSLNQPGATEGMKRERLRSGLMDSLTGGGDPFAGGPLGNILKATNPMDHMAEAQGQVDALPSVTGGPKKPGDKYNGLF